LLDEGSPTFDYAAEWDLRTQAPSKREEQLEELADMIRADEERRARAGTSIDPRLRPQLPVLKHDPELKRFEEMFVPGAIFWAYILYEIGRKSNTLPYYWESHLHLLDMFFMMIGKPTVGVRRVVDLPGDNHETKWEHRLVESVQVQIEACHYLLTQLDRQPAPGAQKLNGDSAGHPIAKGQVTHGGTDERNESPLTALSPSDEIIRCTRDALGGRTLRLFNFLVGNEYKVTFDELRNDSTVFTKPKITDDGISTGIKDLIKCLNAMNAPFLVEWSKGDKTVRLDGPRKKNA
jgi:hypothetical protein